MEMYLSKCDRDAAEDVIYVGLKLNRRTDADIIEAIDSNRQLELKRLMRIGMRELDRRRAAKSKHKCVKKTSSVI